MKTLIITAHPSSKGFTHEIADLFVKTRAEAGHEAEIMNLYDKEWEQGFLTFEDMREAHPETPVRTAIHEKISAADELVFIYPMWWFTAPAIMKNFIDQNFSAGFAFKYEKGKPKGLLTGKTARVFVTADGPKAMYTLAKPFMMFPIVLATLKFCGIKTASFDVFPNMRGMRQKKNGLDVYRKRVIAQAKKVL